MLGNNTNKELKKKLRVGITTGTCAAAATAAAVEAFFLEPPRGVSIELPDKPGRVFVPIQSVHVIDAGNGRQQIDARVIKDAGDDPDVTHHARIGAKVTIEKGRQNQVVIKGGPGVGRVTRPGLPVPVGDPAINPVPRKMIEHEVMRRLSKDGAFRVTTEIYVENGEQIAKKTLNPRLGIVGGISILGTSGIVKPFSAKSYRETIDICLRSARSGGEQTCVLSTGRRSERVAQQYYPHLHENCFVQFADFFFYALKAASKSGFEHMILSGFFGKLCKWAMNMAYTHARSGLIDFIALSDLALSAGCSEAFGRRIKAANNAREIFEFKDPQVRLFVDAVGQKALENAYGFMTGSVRLSINLWDFKEQFYAKWDSWER